MIPAKRMLHTKIWYSDQFASLKPIECLLYIGMITLGDDDGRLRGDGRFLGGQIFPFRKISPRQVEKMRDRIAEVGLIVIYSTQKGLCISHPNWNQYQTLRKDRAKPSDIPPPLVANPQPTDNQASAQGNSERRKENRSGTEDIRSILARRFPDQNNTQGN